MPDLRYAFRMLLRQRGFTAIAVLALALGMGANTAIFSIANAVVLRPLPYPAADRLVILNQRTQTGEVWNVSSARFAEWERNSRSFSAIAAVSGGNAVLTGRGEPERIPVIRVSPGFFRVFGCRPELGRTFAAGEPVALLSHGAWERRFGRGTLGQAITLDGATYTVSGVLPASFRFMRPFEALLPLGNQDALNVFATRRAGVSVRAAQDELGRLALVEDLKQRLTTGPRQDLPLLFGAAAFVLLIACANVASLLLAKGPRGGRRLPFVPHWARHAGRSCGSCSRRARSCRFVAARWEWCSHTGSCGRSRARSRPPHCRPVRI